MAELRSAGGPRGARFEVGTVLGDTFSIWFRNLVPFFVLAIIVQSPIIIYFAAVLSGDMSGLTEDSVMRLVLVGAVGGFLLDFVVTGAIAYGVFRQLSGARAGILECIVVGLRRLLPVLGVGILVALSILLGMVLLIVPGIIAACMLYVAVPVAVVESPGVMESLRRSAALTDGVKGSIFGIALLIGGIERIAEHVVDTVTGAPESMSDLRTSFFVTLAVALVAGLLQSVAQAVSYYHLRMVKEGIGIAELVEVFD